MMRIASTGNPRVKEVRRLHRGRERRSTGRTILEGPTLVETALAAGTVPLALYTVSGGVLADRARDEGAEIVTVSEPVLESLSTTPHPQDPVAVIPIPASPGRSTGPLVALVDVTDPGNTGTLIRSAAAFGWSVAVVGGADPWSPKVLRSGMGAHFATPLVVFDGPGPLFDEGNTTIATVVDGGEPPDVFAGVAEPTLLVGNETRGLGAGIPARCDRRLTLPMPGGFESLNVAIAGSLAMYLLSFPSTGSGIPSYRRSAAEIDAPES